MPPVLHSKDTGSSFRSKGKHFLQLSVLSTDLELSEEEVKAVLFFIFVIVFVKKMSRHKISTPDLFSLGAVLCLRLRQVVMRIDNDME